MRAIMGNGESRDRNPMGLGSSFSSAMRKCEPGESSARHRMKLWQSRIEEERERERRERHAHHARLITKQSAAYSRMQNFAIGTASRCCCVEQELNKRSLRSRGFDRD